MENYKNDQCKQCGAVISANSNGNLCPACLMSVAMKHPICNDETASFTSSGPIMRFENADLPCELGNYRLLGLLGRGGMGIVYEAEEITTGRRLALKMLGQMFDSPDLRMRFLREGRLAAGVNHPNSLYVFGSEVIDGLPVITMEIARGGTLKDKIKDKGPLKVSEAVDSILDVISGLESAHAEGVLHRDIKPSNCFIGNDGSVKVGDYGLSISTTAKTDTFVTGSGSIMGTPAYASPEQLQGDPLDLRSDIYSTGATLFTLLSCQAPFDGDNAVQVVANAVNKEPKSITNIRNDIPTKLDQIISRCLSKNPNRRYADYTALRNELLPFSSLLPKPASFAARVSAGWIDFLLAFLIPYIFIMLLFGSDELIVRPLVERTLYSFRYYFAFLGCGFLYFSFCEGFFGAGLGKYLKGLYVARPDGKKPGFARALLRIVIPVLCVEGVRIPWMLALISGPEWTSFQTVMYVLAANICGWIPVIIAMCARSENGYATIWEKVSGTQVLIKPEGAVRPSVVVDTEFEMPVENTKQLGPFNIVKKLVPGQWLAASDPVLSRQVWLIKRDSENLADSRKNLARPGRLRWLQSIEADNSTWDAFDATRGISFLDYLKKVKNIPWSALRFWLLDLASELWKAAGDNTLPNKLCIDNIWLSSQGSAVILEKPWPYNGNQEELYSVNNIDSQQRFLSKIADYVDSTTIPIHAKGFLDNLKNGNFDKLSFLTGILQGLSDRPAEVTKGIRAASIFVLPLFVWVAAFVGYYHDKQWNESTLSKIVVSALTVLGVLALTQMLELPFKNTIGQFTFRLAVIESNGRRAGIAKMFYRWLVVWLPLFIPIIVPTIFTYNGKHETSLTFTGIILALWICFAVYTVFHQKQGIHDKLTKTWVVRR